VQWKRGGPPPLPLPAPGKDGKVLACPDFERPALAPGVAARVAEGEAAAAAAAARGGSRREALLAALARERRSALEMETDEMLAPRKRIKVGLGVGTGWVWVLCCKEGGCLWCW